MRITNFDGRLVLLDGPAADGVLAYDVERASDGRFGASPQAVYDDWEAFTQWATGALASGELGEGVALELAKVGPLTPRPPQVFAVGLNYSAHAAESGFEPPAAPVVFTKYASSFTGPVGDVELSDGNVDWEVELVVVIGRGGRDISQQDAWDHVAGVTIGQDISDRTEQFVAAPAQFGLGKSYKGYAPVGPALVTLDELTTAASLDDLELVCSVNGREVQHGSTKDMIFPVPRIIEYLSSIVELLPGDVIFTGTPDGVGMGMKPPTYLTDGDVVHTSITGLGELTQRMVARAR